MVIPDLLLHRLRPTVPGNRIIAFGLAALMASAVTASAAEKIVLQLRSDHQFQFAGYYAALWQGYYADAGLAVTIRSAVTPDGTILRGAEEVSEGRAQFGIGAGDILLARENGKPLIVVANIFQHSPVAIFARRETGLSSPADLTRMKVARSLNNLADVEFQSVLRAEGIDPRDVPAVFLGQRKVRPFDLLKTGEVDAYAGYVLTGLWRARQAGIELSILRPATYGVDFYGDALFTSERLTRERPELVQKFIAASLKGWRYALEHRAEIADRIADDLPRKFAIDDPRGYNRFNSEIVSRLTHYPVIELGHINPDRWRRMHDALREAGLVSGSFNQARAIFDPAREERRRQQRFNRFMLIAALLLAVLAAGAVAWCAIQRRMEKWRLEIVEKSEEKNRLILEAAGEGIYGLDRAGKTIFVNPAACGMLGYEAHELIGGNMHELVHHSHPDGTHYPREDCPIYATRTAGRVCHGENEVFWRKDGSSFPVAYTSTPIRKKGRLVGAVMTFSDITRGKKAENALRDSEEKYRDLIERSMLAIQIKSRDRRRVFANSAFLGLFGYDTKEDVCRQQAHAFVAPEDRDHMKRLREARDDGDQVPDVYEFCARRKDGSSFPVQAYSRPIIWEGEFAQQITYIDLSERKKAEEDLRRKEAQLRLVTDTMPAYVAYIDRDQRIQFASKPYARRFGYSVDDITGKHLRQVKTAAEYQALLPDISRTLAGHNTMNEGERHGFPDGKPRYHRTIRAPHFGDDGEVHGYFVVILDITEHRQREEQLRHAQKMEAVGQLTGGVAHDFNNILTVAIGNLDLLSDNLQDGELLDYVEKATKAAHRGAELTHRLLAFSRRQSLAPQVIDLNEYVTSITAMMGRTLGAAINIEVRTGAGLWNCRVDPGQIENAILNLALNARDAMPKGGSLVIETRNLHSNGAYDGSGSEIPPGEYVVVSVSDTGTGMSQTVVDRAFEPFFTTKDAGKGSGLGLSMIYGFIKQSGGHVVIESSAGAGTTVTLYLPRTDRAPEPARHGGAGEKPVSQGERILVVEDDPEVRSLTVAMLRDLGYDIVGAADGREAIDALHGLPCIDVLFTDVVLPGGISGVDLAAEATRSRPDIKVLYTSGYSDDILARHDRMDAEIQLINKPFRKTDLARVLRSVLDDVHA